MSPRLAPGDLKALSLALVLVAAILAVALLQHLGALIMRHRKFILVAAAALSAFALAGCTAGVSAQVLNNVEHCKRHYFGVAGGLTPSISVDIQCDGKPYAGVAPGPAAVAE